MQIKVLLRSLSDDVGEQGDIWMRSFILGSAFAALCVTGAVAQDEVTTYSYDGSFDDAAFGVESAIVGRGLVIDWTSHVGDMLNRTAADVGSETELFRAADVYLFCSAVVSRKVMEADPMNIAHCPYGVFVVDQDGEVTVGFKNYPEGTMQDVQALLDGIAREAVGLE